MSKKRLGPRFCYLCGRNGSADPLDKHHIFGGPNRSKSEKYGLYVYLCHSECHIFGKHAVHNDAEVMQQLRDYGQRKAMKENGWSIEDFRAVFGTNYIDEEPEEETAEVPVEAVDSRSLFIRID